MISEIAASAAMNLALRGPMEKPTHYGVSGTPGDGPYVQIWLEITDGTIVRAAFKTPGCPSSTAVASALCAIVTGREGQRVLTLTPGELIALAGGLPEGKGHYADKCIEALKNAYQGGLSHAGC